MRPPSIRKLVKVSDRSYAKSFLAYTLGECGKPCPPEECSSSPQAPPSEFSQLVRGLAAEDSSWFVLVCLALLTNDLLEAAIIIDLMVRE